MVGFKNIMYLWAEILLFICRSRFSFMLDYCYFGARRLGAAGCFNFHDTQGLFYHFYELAGVEDIIAVFI